MGLFDILKNIKPVPGAGVATAYGIPKASVVGKVSEDTSKSDAKLCCHCGVEVSLEDKNCPKCGKKLGYLKDNESQHKGE